MMMTTRDIVRLWLLWGLLLPVTFNMTSVTLEANAQSQKLVTEPLEIVTSRGKFTFDVEIADEPAERSIGLMNRRELEPRGGMLFVFERPQIIEMWMKNTLISLDMIFTDKLGKVVSIEERTVPHSLSIISSRVPASYVLELAGGMAAFIGIKPGDRLNHKLFSQSGG